MTSSPVTWHEPCNEVHLIGRVTSEPEVTVLSSGDELLTMRLSIPRPRPPAGRGRRSGTDTVACAAWTASVRRRVRGWCKDDLVEVRGSLRRRFWRDEQGTRSRYEVELVDVTLLRQASATPSVPVEVEPVGRTVGVDVNVSNA